MVDDTYCRNCIHSVYDCTVNMRICHHSDFYGTTAEETEQRIKEQEGLTLDLKYDEFIEKYNVTVTITDQNRHEKCKYYKTCTDETSIEMVISGKYIKERFNPSSFVTDDPSLYLDHIPLNPDVIVDDKWYTVDSGDGRVHIREVKFITNAEEYE